jgi:Periplasmic component of the Tol biopolymer transport system
MKFSHSNHYPLIVFLAYLSCVNVFGQSKFNEKETFTEAESYFLYEEYADALPLYVKLKDQIPDNYNLSYKIGRCYLNLPYEKQKSIAFLEDAVKYNSGKPGVTSLRELRAPSDALFYLGDAYRVNNQLEKAIQAYQRFKEKASNKTYDLELVDHQIKSCQRALTMEKRPITVKMVNLGDVINTRFSETNPVITPDETMIVYATRLPFYQAVFYSKKVNGRWTDPVNMIPELGVDGDCFPTCISHDGRELFVYRSDQFRGDLYVTNYINGSWTRIRKLNSNINTKYFESHASISPDGKTLYFTSNRNGGFGGLDIYKSTRVSTTTDDWGPAVNLGPTINSEYNEDSPFLTEDGKRMFFSSFGHETLGGYDIFYSDLKDDGTWGEPVNLGYPINTPDDEVFYNPLKDGSVGYMARFEPQGFGKFDIYRFDVRLNSSKSLVIGAVKIPSAIRGEIYLALYDKEKKDTVLRLTTTNGKFSFEVYPGEYELTVKCNGCQPQVIALSVPQGTIQKDIEVEIKPSESIIVPSLAATELPGQTSDMSKHPRVHKIVAKPVEKSEGESNTKNNTDTSARQNVVSDSTSKEVLAQKGPDTLEQQYPKERIWGIPAGKEYLVALATGILFFLIFIIIKRRKRNGQDS